MAKAIWIWQREDGQPACVLQIGTAPRGEGKVYEVTGRKGRQEAANTVRLALSPEPNVDESPEQWARWRGAVNAVRLVSEEEFSND